MSFACNHKPVAKLGFELRPLRLSPGLFPSTILPAPQPLMLSQDDEVHWASELPGTGSHLVPIPNARMGLRQTGHCAAQPGPGRSPLDSGSLRPLGLSRAGGGSLKDSRAVL